MVGLEQASAINGMRRQLLGMAQALLRSLRLDGSRVTDMLDAFICSGKQSHCAASTKTCGQYLQGLLRHVEANVIGPFTQLATSKWPMPSVLPR